MVEEQHRQIKADMEVEWWRASDTDQYNLQDKL